LVYAGHLIQLGSFACNDDKTLILEVLSIGGIKDNESIVEFSKVQGYVARIFEFPNWYKN